MKHTLEAVAPRVVRVHDRWGHSLGFVFHSPYHVLTSFSAVFWRDGGWVELPDGSATTFRVVAHDAAADLAILELARTTRQSPLLAGPSPAVGDPVYAVGTTEPWSGGTASIHPGVVNAKQGDRIHTDALDAVFHKQGGPLLDCAGRLVGIAGAAWGNAATTVDPALALADGIGRQPIYEGLPVTPHLLAGAVAHVNEHAAGGGVALGMAIEGIDGWRVSWLGGVLALAKLDDGEQRGLRLFGQTLFGYHLPIDERRTFGVDAGAGLTIAYEQYCEGQCSEINPPWHRETRFLPTLEVGFRVWPARLGYQLQLDLGTTSQSIHHIMLGVDF